MTTQFSKVNLDQVVVKFAGDSGDGMQLTGTIFSEVSAKDGNDLSTFPDYPAEIRAPQNTVAGVSGFQVHIGSTRVLTSGDHCDVLVAMNPASLKANLKWAKLGATVLVDADVFTEEAIEKAGYANNPLTDGSLSSYALISAPVTSLTLAAVNDLGLDNKSAEKCRNMFALGVLVHLFNKDLEEVQNQISLKFHKKPKIGEANRKVLEAGWIYADNLEILSSTFHVGKASLEPGKYRNITGNIATAWGLVAAAEKSGRPLFLGSYPITPATDILTELSQLKSLGVKTFQAEDEIAGICSAIGASLAGSLAATSTSGPGLALKAEAIGLAVITELPLVVVNVQRAGPSTGMPTKSEQGDLFQALYGRNGESPTVVMAASSPSDCFYAAFEACRIALEHMTPVILLTDGYIGNGSQLFRIPSMADMPKITPPLALPNQAGYKPYARDPKTWVRQWAIPGTEGLRHRLGSLEKTEAGLASTDPENHQKMVNLRAGKIQKVAGNLPLQVVEGDAEGELLLVSWGGTYGAVRTAMERLRKSGVAAGHVHFRYIQPLPENTREIFGRYQHRIVCELNSGQFAGYLRMMLPQYTYEQYNEVTGQPFIVEHLIQAINNLYNNLSSHD